MQEYHLRRPEKAIENEDELIEVILGQKHTTIAMCRDNKPYLATVNYYFDSDEKFFYFHCSNKGKKIDYLKANPIVWGQILEDNGYIQNECDHAYRTVQFKGVAEFLKDDEEIINALTKMMEQLEDNPTEERIANIKNRDLTKVAICKIKIEGMSGKKNEEEK
jgi:nitroimidazol reductase NimA-like FMN-containing flavoprotein (pyridoxamine 5'-phosphate oxidase superfamily)